jgi:transposase-like protein
VSILSEPHFHNEEAAFARLEGIVWPNGPVCPHCGNADPKRVYAIKGKSTRPGLRTCAECRKQFTCKVGTVFESSHIPLHKWFQAAHLLASSKKGISSHQLHRTLKVSYKTAWFMSHRLREVMRSGALAVPFGSGGGAVESDETFHGRRKGVAVQRGYNHKRAVLSLLDRDTPQVRSFHVDHTSAAHVVPILKANIANEATIMTDEAGQYAHLKRDFPGHEFVVHSAEEYVRGDVHTNNLESFYSIFKRGMKGVYQHCSENNLHRYLPEFDFRYNNRTALGVEDTARATKALHGIVGKRLTYRDSSVGRA